MANLQESNTEKAQEEARIRQIVSSQKAFFNTGKTKDVSWRITQLKKLYEALKRHESDIFDALQQDLMKNPFDSYATEVGIILTELRYCIKHVKSWSKTKKLAGSCLTFPAKSRIIADPFGVTLIMSPWNYPFVLSFDPLIAAIAAGNTAILKTSEYSVASNAVIRTIVEEIFDPEFVAVIEGGYLQNQILLKEHFDFIFFTGSPAVGKIVMESAAKNLTPVCLELGGKSPCIVDESANLQIAARRIVWGKLLNGGQTCVAPDYLLVHSSVKESLVQYINDEIKNQYGTAPLENPEYTKIINKKHFNRLLSLAPQASMNVETNRIGPTVMDLGTLDGEQVKNHPVMQEEIFGPLLPVITYENLDDVISFVGERPSPLALYFFSQNKESQQKIVHSLRFGGGCINDVIVHLTPHNLPFGGCGHSGMGQYHGKYGFDTFTHYKSVLVQSPKTDVKIRYTPHKNRIKLLKLFLR